MRHVTENPKYIAVAKMLVAKIKDQALALGWTPAQLDELTKILPTFIPAKIGAITLQSIQIITLHSDGSHRGAVNYYNMAVDQPWMKLPS